LPVPCDSPFSPLPPSFVPFSQWRGRILRGRTIEYWVGWGGKILNRRTTENWIGGRLHMDRRTAEYCRGRQHIKQEDGKILSRMAAYWKGGRQRILSRTKHIRQEDGKILSRTAAYWTRERQNEQD
jgi:hypothetical protein